MPTNPTYPGVYVEEIPSGVRTITGVPTATTAFVGRAAKGPDDRPVVINSFAEFESTFGGLAPDSTMSFAVRDFYLNGGGKAIIVRIAPQDVKNPDGTIKTPGAKKAKIHVDTLKLQAKYVGAWGNTLRVRIDYKTRDPSDPNLFNLSVSLRSTDPTVPTVAMAGERFLNVTVDKTQPRSIGKVIAQSELVAIAEGTQPPANRPKNNEDPTTPGADPFADSTVKPPTTYTEVDTKKSEDKGSDGGDLTDLDVLGDPGKPTGIYLLLKLQDEIFNLLCIPPLTRTQDVDYVTVHRDRDAGPAHT